jgi:hypothetical protein
MFDYPTVHSAVAPLNVPKRAGDIDLPQLDPDRRLGVGRASDGAFVLVGPGQATARILTGRQFSFDPWKELVDRRSNVVLKDVCVLRFRPIDDETEVRDAVAAVFLGLVELALSTPNALGDAIEAMESLFESGLKSRVSRETEIGLAGELLVIAESADSSRLATTWHTKSEGQFDFSEQGERLEVKTTTGAERVHWFSSGQLEPIPGVCTSFISIILPVVEAGSTVASLFASLSNLTERETARVRSIIINTAKEPPEILTSIVFDRTAARASILHIAPSQVPTPTRAPWGASAGRRR